MQRLRRLRSPSPWWREHKKRASRGRESSPVPGFFWTTRCRDKKRCPERMQLVGQPFSRNGNGAISNGCRAERAGVPSEPGFGLLGWSLPLAENHRASPESAIILSELHPRRYPRRARTKSREGDGMSFQRRQLLQILPYTFGSSFMNQEERKWKK